MTATDRDHFVLFTNIEYAWIGQVRLYCAALVLDGHHDAAPMLRGFGYDPSWPVFEIQVPGLNYTVRPTETWSYQVLTASGEQRPLGRGGILSFTGSRAGQVDLSFMFADPAHELDALALQGTRDERTIMKIWEALPERVERYYTAPAIPELRHRISRRERERREQATANGIARSNEPVRSRRP